MKIEEFCTYAPKSGIKAGEATNDGKYMFFTSSEDESKRYTDYQFDGEGIIMGTGGNATLHYFNGKYAVSTDCIVVLPDDRVRCKYLYYFFLANMSLLEAGFKGAGLKHTNKKYIGNITIKRIPPIIEQDRIIMIMDTICGIIRNRKKEFAAFDELIKAHFVEMFGDPLHPSRYNKLGEIALLERGRFSPRPRNDPRYYGGMYPFIQTGDIASSNHRLIDYKQTLNEEGIKVSKKFDIGTIVIAIVGATIGSTAILQREVYAPDSVIGISPYKYHNVFLETLLQFWQPTLLAKAPESARANINLSILNDIPIIEACLNQQEQFAAFVAQVDKSKSVVQKALDEAQLLFDSLMQQYFG